MPRPVRLPVVPLAVPTQLVLALPVGIERPRRKRRSGRHPWLPAPVAKERVA